MEKGERGEEIEKGERERGGGNRKRRERGRNGKRERGRNGKRARRERESCVSFARVLVNQCEGL